MIPLSIATEGYLHGVLSIAVRGYLGGDAEEPITIVGAALIGQAGSVTVDAVFITFDGIPITNPTAFVRDQSGVTICARSGMIAKPGQLVMDPHTGGWVLPKYVDEYQPEPEKYRTKDRTKGARRPEDGINWITTPVDPDDL